MLYKSKDRKRSLQLSAAAHGLLIGAFVVVSLVRRNVDVIEFAVIDAPVISQQATQKPEPVAPAKKQEVKPKQNAVFGVSRKALVNTTPDSESVTTKAGNTVAKEEDKKKLGADDPDALPIPADEFLVSAMPKLLNEVRIPYPPEARKRGVQGAVVIDLLIDAYGRVRESKFVSGPGFGLNEAALEAVRGFQFEPARIQDKKVAVRIRYAYRFILN